jgi:hypothetical protein
MQFDQLGRRQFIAFLSNALVARPLAAFAQRPSMPAIGYLSARTPEDSVEVLADFRRGLAETGFKCFGTNGAQRRDFCIAAVEG